MSNDPGEEESKKEQSSADINKAITDLLKRSNRVRISGLNGQDNIAVGLHGDYEIDIKGNGGRYLGAFNSGPVIILQGSCGDLAADCLIHGGLIITGSSGKKCGLGMKGGIVVVKGDCGSDLGKYNRNGTIIVNGNISGDVGERMVGGTIMVTGDIQGEIGLKAEGGSIFVVGQVGKLAKGITELKPDEKDLQKMKKYFDHYGISAVPKSFRKFITGQR